MEIRIRSTGQVMFWNEFRDLLLQKNPSELITVAAQTQEWLAEHGADVVLEGPQATGGTRYQYSMRQGVEEISGSWYTKYILGPIFTDGETTAAEQETAYRAMRDAEQAKSVRQSRDQKLKDLDWTQGKDIPETVSGPAATLRQALRDVPTQEGFPWDIVWPDAE
jgi:hypothetical protein